MAAMDNVVFIDTETTGLDPDRHEVWEIGLIRAEDGVWVEHRIVVTPMFPARADSTALRINRFYDRYDFADAFTPAEAAQWVATLTAGRHLAGAVPSFDAVFLDRLLRANGFVPAWHYHLIDVEALAVGYLAGLAGAPRAMDESPAVRTSYSPPWESNALSVTLGVAQREEDRHTALGDARWAKAIYERVMG